MPIPTVKVYTYKVVVAPGPFPYDMLRHDRAWPTGHSPEHFFGDMPASRTVSLWGLNLPTVDRWRSFNCAVFLEEVGHVMQRCDQTGH